VARTSCSTADAGNRLLAGTWRYLLLLLLLQILVGNKSDMADEKRAVPYAKGQALAEEYGMRFFETSAKDNLNVEEVGYHHQQL
jgi:GTPase SAR1 family protein